ncbi:MAG: hypothetical protein IE917_10790 [Betaproteobacteria bacterium]|nr:hypothetical protein [Betaproteobacteria bacterium]
MARARNLKPGFFHNADLVELPVETRLLFAGLWTLADREGRIIDRPKQIKMEIYPADSFDVDSMLQALHDFGFILRYKVNGIRYIQVLNFLRHQNPHHAEKPSLIPAPDKPEACPGLNVLIPESINLNPESHSRQQQGASCVGRQPAQDEPLPEPDQPDEQVDETPPPEENPPLPEPHADAIAVRAVGIAVLLRQRGAGVAAGDVRLRQWAERGVTDAALLTALETAEKRRAAAGNLNPVNAGLLDAILADARSPPKSGSGVPWWSTDQTVLAKGRELGVEPRPGESMGQFKGRLTEKIGQIEGAEA